MEIADDCLAPGAPVAEQQQRHQPARRHREGRHRQLQQCHRRLFSILMTFETTNIPSYNPHDTHGYETHLVDHHCHGNDKG